MLIYKIVPAPLWRDAEAAGVFDGAPIDLADGYIHFSTAAQARETAASHFAGQADLLLVAVDADDTWPGPAIRALARRRSVPASLSAAADCGRPMGRAAAARRRRRAPSSRSMRDRTPAVASSGPLGRHALLCSTIDAETAHGLTHRRRCSRAAALSRAGPRRPRLAVEAVRPRLPQPARHGGRLRQERRGARRAAGPRLRLCRGRHASRRCRRPAIRKPRIFRLTADEGVINRLGFNNEGHDRRAGAAERARRARRHRRRQHRRQQGQRRPHRRLRRRASTRFARWRDLSHRQHLLAQHARPARPAAGERLDDLLARRARSRATSLPRGRAASRCC